MRLKKYIKISVDFKMRLLELLRTNKNFIFCLTAFSFILSDNIVDARPGGGHSYGGGGGGSSHSYGGRSSSSGGSSGDGGLIFELIFRFIFRPLWELLGLILGYQVRNTLAIILIIGLCIYGFIHKQTKEKDIFVITSNKKVNNPVNQYIDDFKSKDTNFSRVIFLDFVNSLYQKFYYFQRKKDFVNIKPFITDNFFANEKNNYDESYSNIVIGSIDVLSLKINNAGIDSILVQINANYTLPVNNKPIKFEAIERWKFIRKSNILSKEPDVMRTLSCPNCGAPGNFNDAGTCLYCNTLINSGQMQWALDSRNIINEQQLYDVDPGGYVAETGTHTPSIIQSTLEQNVETFSQFNHITNWNTFQQSFKTDTVEKYFIALYSAWSDNNLSKVRGLLSDRLYESWDFWIKNYKSKNWANKLTNIKINNMVLVAIDLDKYYESITLRIFASCFDYTVDKTGRVIGGSDTKARQFSEYWTFIRSKKADSSKSKDSFNISSCPSCGNSADKINQSGICEYCGSKITNGDFSWVLTAITQDESYKG